jgi:hypothetical protein
MPGSKILTLIDSEPRADFLDVRDSPVQVNFAVFRVHL